MQKKDNSMCDGKFEYITSKQYFNITHVHSVEIAIIPIEISKNFSRSFIWSVIKQSVIRQLQKRSIYEFFLFLDLRAIASNELEIKMEGQCTNKC